MPDYSKGKIYTIRCRNDPSLVYVGSTIQSLAKRFGGHKGDWEKKDKYPNHQLYSKIDDWNDWYIELYLNYPCNSVEELRQKEGEIIRLIGNLNRCVAGRTRKQSKQNWIENNKEYFHEYTKQYSKLYNETHKTERLEYSRVYEATKRNRERINCACGGFYMIKYKQKHEQTKLHQNHIPAG